MNRTTDQPTKVKRKQVPIPIRAKLFAALVVPLVAVAALCWVQVSQARDHVAEVEAETSLARVALSPDGLVGALIVEQADATVTALSLRETATIPTENWEESVAQTDAALTAFRDGLEESGPVAEALFADTLADLEADLETQRAEAERMMAEPGLPNLVPVLDELYPAYSATITQLIDANTELADAISDPQMRRAAQVLNAVNEVHFNVSGLMSSVGTGILRPGNEGRDPVVFFLRDFEQSVERLRGMTDGPWEDAVTAFAENDRYQQIIDRGQDFLTTNEIDLDAYIQLNPPVETAATAPPGTTQFVARTANEELAAIIDTQLEDARAEEQRYTLLAILVMVFATAAALLVARSILKPMKKLTEQAEDMAAVTLPAAVQGVLATPPDQDVVIPELPPVDVKSRDELQTVAEAINHVQASALDLAVEQATLRRNIADSFVSLGRRTQNLIGLQLEQITALEHDETDPAVLESLYRLDHLATRARRNAESLVVLGGTEAQRRGGSPVVMSDVVRAMLSEVEAYQRVDITNVDHALIPGSSAADVIHLLAELVENGLSFSPPNKNVRVRGEAGSAGYTITIVDEGVGMTADKLEQANRRLSDNESFTIAPSRYLGHYVTGKLARRVGAQVSLAANPDGGVIATVVLPTSALMSEEEAARAGGAASAAPTAKETRTGGGASSAVDSHLDDPSVKVDGRPPTAPAAPAEAATNGSASTNGSDGDAAPQVEIPVETTENGLRKRVPGQHAKAVAERSPLLRSAAARAEKEPLAADTSPQEAQNLASLLSDYTSGLERGKEELAESASPTSPTERSE
jgi:signal transduction histidine kinase